MLPTTHPADPLSIAVAGVTVSLAGKKALRAVSWSLTPGQHWAVLGPNGAGKSTFLRLLRGDVRPDQTPQGDRMGSCAWTIDGEAETSPLMIKPLARLISAEQHRLYVRKGWKLTGLDLILSAFTDSLLPSPADKEQIATATAVAENLGAGRLLQQAVTAMSQGQLRLILLARAMASAPRLLLLDEPFDGLDTANRDTLHAAVNRVAQNAAVILTAHRERDVPSCISHILRLEGGKAVNAGPVSSVPQAADNAAHAPDRTGTAVAAQTILVPEKAAPPAAGTGAGTQYALELENADVYVNRAKVLRNLTWQLPLGESWRIGGGNGAGKSTLLRLIAGLEQVALGGKLLWYGIEHPPLETRLRETGYLSDALHATYFYDLTGLELVLSGFDGSVGVWRKFSKAEREEARHWIEFLGLSAMARTPVSRLSSGTSRRFFLARALVGPVRLLLLDEPCSGLDAPSREQLIAALENVLASGVQCLYVSHHDEDVPPSIKRELRLEQGKIAAVR